MDSKTCSAFPVMGDRPYSAFLRSSRAKGFNSGPPAHPDNFFILVSNFDGVEYMCQDGYGHLDCEWSFDMVPLSVCFSIFIVWSFPFDIFSKGYRSSPSSSWLVTKKIKVLLWDCQSVFTTCPQRLLVIASWIPRLPNSCFSAWFISRMFLNCSPSGGAKFFHCNGFETCPIRFGR